MKTKKLPFIVIFLGVIGMSLINLLPKSNYKTAIVQKGKVKINVLIADSPQKRAVGLSGRSFLKEDEGMLFYFNENSYPGIWMKKMRFPIDIIWLEEDKVVDFAQKIPPPEEDQISLPTYTPGKLANRVLELNSGMVEKLGLKIGDTIKVISY